MTGGLFLNTAFPEIDCKNYDSQYDSGLSYASFILIGEPGLCLFFVIRLLWQ